MKNKTNYWNFKSSTYNYPYNKFVNFLDTVDLFSYLTEFSEQYDTVDLFIPQRVFITFIISKIEDSFKKFCEINELTDFYDLLFKSDSIEFWDEYLTNKLDIWSYNNEAFYSVIELKHTVEKKKLVDNYPTMKFPISNLYIVIDNVEYKVGVVLGPAGQPTSPFSTEKVSLTEYKQGIIDNKYSSIQYINDLVFHLVYNLKSNTDSPYKLEEKWINELIDQGIDLTNLNYELISNN